MAEREEGWWVKPTIDTITYIENVMASFDENVKITLIDGKLVQLTVFDVKGHALNIIVPIAQAAAGQKEWDEAIANGVGSVLQDLLVAAVATAVAIVVLGTAVLSTEAAIVVGGVALLGSWTLSAYTDGGLGGFLERELKAGKKSLTIQDVLSDNHVTIPTGTTIKDFTNNAEFSYDKQNLASITSGSIDTQMLAYKFTLNNLPTVDKFTINSITYDITQGDNLLVRNAIFDIPKVSFLLSHIDIHGGDILDLGDKGLYKVVSGDTMSEIAEANGMTTQQLLSYNTWLIDDNRVTFDQDKVLVANLEPSDFTDKDHNLTGCELEDRLIDHNDGDDTLLGMGGDDYLDGGKGADQLAGGKGFDTYISDNGDKLFDEDGEGEVYFDETLLTGGKKEAGSGCEPTEDDGSSIYKGNGGTYTLSGDTLTFKKGGETLTMLNLSDKRLVA